MASALVAVGAELDGAPGSAPEAWSALERLAARVRARHRGSGGPGVDDLRAVLFDEEKFQREIDSDDPRFFVLSSVLATRRGSCLGLGALMLALGERVGVPLDGIMVPGHFFVRTREAPARNIELLRAGEAMPDDWYRAKYGPWPAASAEYFRPLDATEVAGVHWFNAGNYLRRRGDLAAAAGAFARAAQEFPTFAEAYASLGAAEQQQGKLPAAALAYERAARVRPDLPGLERNRALLDQQLSFLSADARSPDDLSPDNRR
jgi:regulator of sirC expression with transglutaminase-like and TPR domain